MTTRLYQDLQAEIQKMNPQQKSVFKQELAKVIPQAVKTAADKAKKAPETAPVKNNVTKSDES